MIKIHPKWSIWQHRCAQNNPNLWNGVFIHQNPLFRVSMNLDPRFGIFQISSKVHIGWSIGHRKWIGHASKPSNTNYNFQNLFLNPPSYHANHDHPINHFEVSDRKSDATMMIKAIDLAKGVDLIELDRSKSMKSQGSLSNYDALRNTESIPFHDKWHNFVHEIIQFK